MDLQEMNSNAVHVLLVDYDQNSLPKSTLVLKNASFRVTPTKVQQVALTLLREFKGEYNMVIISDQKQDLDCRSFIQRIRSIQDDIPIIVILSSENNNQDQGLKTLFDSACYVIDKPANEHALWSIWQRHQIRSSLNVTKDKEVVPNAKGKQVVEIGEGSETNAVDVPKGDEARKEDAQAGEEDRKLKRISEASENKEEEVAKKKGKGVASSSGEKKSRPSFDPAEHKKLMKAISYTGRKRCRKDQEFQFLQGSEGLEQVAKIRKMQEAFRQVPRAPWTRYLYNRYLSAVTCNENKPVVGGGQGYGGVQQAQPPQMPSRRVKPSWMTPMDWRAQLNSEFLTKTQDLMPSNPVDGFPVFGLADIYTPLASVNGGGEGGGGGGGVFNNPSEFQMPANIAMETPNGFGENTTIGTQSNPIVVEEANNGTTIVDEENYTVSGLFAAVDEADLQSGESKLRAWPEQVLMGEVGVDQQGFGQAEPPATNGARFEDPQKDDFFLTNILDESESFAELLARLDDNDFQG